ncbi:hypothetical protein EMIHUDRAFT_436206 [Emiliania huxleyi CCMP1516]|uniref:JmjC domain-containing protein n=2 Tax=Emiliania huxleyi TaxID=2903 RepID=A0A0D3J5X8_EMIH1|nr:hypothetical protein EMIHUDRAFT_436206 [Emiliania huxleyi CCMP1516]EOD18913.1 hypothetical protein EMIHUDRAFT_436206 [Emiliania huxleyi CCMP1516]|eukprot:XP_005771342.1 hypothetical protein EMIHUDRAFT_436206 [Emiliania huxleyi CCMP1516]
MRAAPRFLPGFARDWPAVASTAGLPPHEAMRWLAGELAAGAGDLVLDAEVGCSYLDAELVPVSVPALAAYLSEPRAAVEAPGPYLAQADLFAERPGLRERLLPPSLTDRTPRPYRTVAWLGGATSSPLHHDPYAGLLVQQIGRKRCALLPPDSPSTQSLPRHTLLQGNSSPVDPFAPRRDTERYPDYPAAAVLEHVLSEGDALLIPRRWWHAVRTDDSTFASFSLTLWWDGASADAEAERFVRGVLESKERRDEGARTVGAERNG